MFHGLLTSPAGTPSTLPRCLSRRAERRLTAGLWLAQAHAYAMALAGVLPGPAAAVTRRCLSSHSPIAGAALPSFAFAHSAPERRTSRSLTLHPWTGCIALLTNRSVCMLPVARVAHRLDLPLDLSTRHFAAGNEEPVAGSAESLVSKVAT